MWKCANMLICKCPHNLVDVWVVNPQTFRQTSLFKELPLMSKCDDA
jgi:hypothetical protein